MIPRKNVVKALKKSEVSLTSLLARELDRFLFPDAGSCLYQLPVSVFVDSGTSE